MNFNEIEKTIAVAYHLKDRETITNILSDLNQNKSKLDRWFDKYIDMFDGRMNTSERSDPVWKLYFQKFNLYSDLNHSIKTANYFMEKLKHV